jgi:hypothetical protein
MLQSSVKLLERQLHNVQTAPGLTQLAAVLERFLADAL